MDSRKKKVKIISSSVETVTTEYIGKAKTIKIVRIDKNSLKPIFFVNRYSVYSVAIEKAIFIIRMDNIPIGIKEKNRVAIRVYKGFE